MSDQRTHAGGRARSRAYVSLCLLLLLFACGKGPASNAASASPPQPTGGLPSYTGPSAPASPTTAGAAGWVRSHIVVVVMENRSYNQIIGAATTPYLTGLARSSVSLTQAYAIRHPSLPNYIALTSGSTHGITTDCTSCFVGGKNLVDQLEEAGITWKAYMESMPSACYKGANSGRYYLKHNPFMYYNDVRNDSARCAKVVPYLSLASDINRGALPKFAWISPNICHDMHDCPPSVGDAWAKAQIPVILKGLGSTGVVIVTFDESSGDDHSSCCGGVAAGGNIPLIIAGPGAKAGITISMQADTYSLLRLIEDNWGLSHLAGAATAPKISGWQR